MKFLHLSKARWLLTLPLLTTLFLAISLLPSPHLSALAEENAETDEESVGIQAFWNFFGPDGVNECLQSESDSTLEITEDSLITFSNEVAILTTAWETVGGGRINRKYLNGLIAFCYDEELAFPNGASYGYVAASEAAIHGQAAAIAQRFGQSGIDNAQWWSECQVAIWAVRAGCQSYESGAAFARSYCADRKITDPATVEDYAYIVGTLVTETLGASGTAYLYQATDPANQRILTCLSVWPDPAPTAPSPLYDVVSAEEEYIALRDHCVIIDQKSASITGEPLAGAVFEIYENGLLVGSITTDAQGCGTCQWILSSTSTSSVTKEYCSNYDKLDPSTRQTITGYTNRDEALSAAQQEALAAARAQAEALADTPCTVTIQETGVPTGFLPTVDSFQTVTLTGNDTVTLSVVNTPWSATFLLDKADGTTGESIPADAAFTLYQWNGSDYEISPHYQIIRQEDGMYTVTSDLPGSQPGQLYYTQANQGRFALVETSAPEGYLLDPQWFFFEIIADGQTIVAHNATPEHYPINDDTKFANQAVTGTIQITKTGDYLTHAEGSPDTNFQYTALPVSGASFSIYTAQDVLVATILSDTSGIARLEGIPLGTYIIRETTAGDGDFLLDPTEITVTLSYKDPFTVVILDDSTHFHNRRQKVSLHITKQSQISSTETSSSPVPLAGATYGLYAAEDIYGHIWDESSLSVTPTKEPLISAHTLLEQVTTDSEGQAFFQSDLPVGQYYIRELSAPDGYLLDDSIYMVDAGYTGADGESVLDLSYTFENAPMPPQPTEEPAPPSSSGAPTGDNSPLLLSCCCLFSSLFLLIQTGLRIVQQRQS